MNLISGQRPQNHGPALAVQFRCRISDRLIRRKSFWRIRNIADNIPQRIDAKDRRIEIYAPQFAIIFIAKFLNVVEYRHIRSAATHKQHQDRCQKNTLFHIDKVTETVLTLARLCFFIIFVMEKRQVYEYEEVVFDMSVFRHCFIGFFAGCGPDGL